jgi:hypothetical protein
VAFFPERLRFLTNSQTKFFVSLHPAKKPNDFKPFVARTDEIAA